MDNHPQLHFPKIALPSVLRVACNCNSYLLLSVIEVGSSSFKFKPINRAELIDMAEEALGMIARAKRAMLKCHPSEEEYQELVSDRPSRKHRKLEEAFALNESKRMRMAEAEADIARLHAAKEALGEVIREFKARRPPPKFECGQTVHHFWAGWMSEATHALSVPWNKTRPRWYMALVRTTPEWKTSTYGDVQYEGWHYHVQSLNSYTTNFGTPEFALNALVQDYEAGQSHTNGLVPNQPPDPIEFYATLDFKASCI
jgi:hypothetical protein